MNEKENLKLWESVQKTDPKFTKEYTGKGGFSGNAVNHAYLVKKITEQFGMCGNGWGYDVLEERFDVGSPIPAKNGQPQANQVTHTLKLAFWYLGKDGQCKSIIHYGHTPYIEANKYGVSTDHEAAKKSLTDAIGKCASMLGFAADIRMGMYDDIHYVNEIKGEAEIERAEDKIEAKERQAAEYREWLETNLHLINTAQSMNELQQVFKSAMRKLDLRKDEANKVKFTRAKDDRKAALEAKEQAA